MKIGQKLDINEASGHQWCGNYTCLTRILFFANLIFVCEALVEYVGSKVVVVEGAVVGLVLNVLVGGRCGPVFFAESGYQRIYKSLAWICYHNLFLIKILIIKSFKSSRNTTIFTVRLRYQGQVRWPLRQLADQVPYAPICLLANDTCIHAPQTCPLIIFITGGAFYCHKQLS